jgi:hypothetical protein
MIDAIYKLNSPYYLSAAILCAIGAIVCVISSFQIFKKKTRWYLKLIPLYAFLVSLQIAVAFYGLLFRKTNGDKEAIANQSAYVLTILEFAIFVVLLGVFIKIKNYRLIVGVSTILFLTVSVILWANLSFIKAISALTILEVIFIVPLCLAYFYTLFTKPPLLAISHEASFWIVTGILFLLLCITPLYLGYSFFRKSMQIQVIDHFGYAIILSLFLKASLVKSKLSSRG